MEAGFISGFALGFMVGLFCGFGVIAAAVLLAKYLWNVWSGRIK